MRERLPDRRSSWTQKVKIGGQSCFLTVGEYEDGRPGEIFVDISKCGTFIRGMVGDLARAVSVALQCGADITTAIYMLRGSHYEPSGPVIGSPNVTHCDSVTDWIASELEAVYVTPHIKKLGEGDVLPIPESTPTPTKEIIPEKIAGYISEPWRSGA